MTGDDALAAMVERIVARFRPEQIVLFGSRARGDASPESDFDILVVLPVCDDARSTAISMTESLADLPVSKDILVTSAEALRARGRLASTVLHSAMEERGE